MLSSLEVLPASLARRYDHPMTSMGAKGNALGRVKLFYFELWHGKD
jgi:hypothetical protein